MKKISNNNKKKTNKSYNKILMLVTKVKIMRA